MKKMLLLLFVPVFIWCNACSYVTPAKKVECCEQKAACCYDQMCCLPRYAAAAGVQPKAFTPETPSYASAEDLQPPPGATVDKSTWLSRLNPYPWLTEEKAASSSSKPKEQDKTKESASTEENESFWGRLWPF